MASPTAPRIEIAPSVLPAEFDHLGDEVAALEAAGGDRIQWDVMDGQFVPNLTFGAGVIAAARKYTTLPFEAHLMTLTPEVLASAYVDAGCQRLIVHAESVTHLHGTLAFVQTLGVAAGVALNPGTPAAHVRHVLDLVDLVLVMTVNPGFGGQRYLPTMEEKVSEVRGMIDASGHQIDVEVDGGIDETTIASAASAGANVFVAGTALFRHPEGLGVAVAKLRATAEATVRARTSPS